MDSFGSNIIVQSKGNDVVRVLPRVNEELNEEFMSMLSEANISGLKGHRSVGGFRASMYNAMPLESVKTLVDVMQELTNKKG